MRRFFTWSLPTAKNEYENSVTAASIRGLRLSSLIYEHMGIFVDRIAFQIKTPWDK